jgi:hypothetical protein
LGRLPLADIDLGQYLQVGQNNDVATNQLEALVNQITSSFLEEVFVNRSQRPGEKTQRLVLAIAILLIVTMLIVSALLVLSLSRQQPDTFPLPAGVMAFSVFATGAAVGVATGFLFGLPRARLVDQSMAPSETGGSDGVPARVGQH